MASGRVVRARVVRGRVVRVETVTSAVLVAVLSAVAAVVIWPGRASGTPRGSVGEPGPAGRGWAPLARDLWSADPAELVTAVWAEGVRLPWRPRSGRVSARQVADLAEMLAPVLRAGADPSAALRRVSVVVDLGSLSAIVAEAAAEAARGGSAGRVFVAAGEGDHDAHGSGALALLGRAWLLSEVAGTPLAGAVAMVGEQVRQREASASALSAATAGPRSSMGLLLLMPLAGPLVALALGLDPLDLYAGTSAGLACLLVALALAGLGWWWSRTLLRRAARTDVAT